MTGRMITVTGGARSGKTRHATELVEAMGVPVAYLATASASDPEMAARIRQHRSERPQHWLTIEEPSDLAAALRSSDLPQPCAILVDCLTVWLGGFVCPLYDLPEQVARDRLPDVEAAALAAIDDLCNDRSGDRSLVVVTNEVGDGIVPADPLTRFYRDTLGRINQKVAAASDEVYLLVAGLPLKIK